ncbi:MAG: hypothetical protein KJ063_14430 [Anaerolineae bacterium]|nr:hypothetical protein [Anaerolineae bacterium]
MAETTTSSNGSEGEAQTITPELVRKIADRVYAMLQLEMKIDFERQRISSRNMTNRQRRGRL